MSYDSALDDDPWKPPPHSWSTSQVFEALMVGILVGSLFATATMWFVKDSVHERPVCVCECKK